jgi:phospholipid transport system transporter-binding protein
LRVERAFRASSFEGNSMPDPAGTATALPQRIELAGNLDIGRAAELRTPLVEALEATHALELELSRVERADTAGLQLLLALARSARERGIAIRWSAPSKPLVETAQRLGLSAALGSGFAAA